MAQVTQQQHALVFTGDLLIGNVSETLSQVRQLTLEQPLKLDFSQIKHSDTSAISLILELQRQCQHTPHHDTLTVVGVSENMRSLMQLYGVDAFLLN